MGGKIDPVLTTVLASGFESVVREMSDTLLRTGRSTIINMARDFSCSLLSRDNEVVAMADGLPIHVAGSGLLGEALHRYHPDLEEGDAFLHNDPYNGNSHAADHVIMTPVFIDGEHMFTTVMKAHQADTGNALPTTFSPTAKDVYEEGALIFPCVKVQSGNRNIDDIIRICRTRIRVPDQWYGDFLGMIGAARVAELRLKKLAARYGAERLRAFPSAWLDYSENITRAEIARLPRIRIEANALHDPFVGTPQEGLALKAVIVTDPENGRIEVDLTDNPDNLSNGLNLTEATARAAAISGVLGSLSTAVPVNSGSFRAIDVKLRKGCVAGIPEFPTSCSVATTNVADRIISMMQHAFGSAIEGFGAAEGGVGQPPAKAVISGIDPRNGARFVNQILLGAQGGPATPWVDGWPTYHRPVADSLLYHDSVEIDEIRYPIYVHERSLMPRIAGHGKQCGGRRSRVVIEDRFGGITFSFALEGVKSPPRGVRGGSDAAPPVAELLRADGTATELAAVATVVLRRGDRIVSESTGGGGYGPPRERDPEIVLEEVRAGTLSVEQASSIYGVHIEDLVIDREATALLRRAGGLA